MWAMIAQMVIQGVSSYMAGRAKSEALAEQKEMAKHREKMAKMDAEAAQRKADYEQTRHILAGAGYEGALRAQLGVSGARTDVGMPLKLVARNWAEVELENFLIGLEGRALKTRFTEEAKLHRRQARIYGKAAKYAFISGILGGGESAMNTLGNYQGSYGGQSSTN